MISDTLEIANTLGLECSLVTLEIEKLFDSVNHWFLLQMFQKFWFGIDFVSWIKKILKITNLRSITEEKQQNIWY